MKVTITTELHNIDTQFKTTSNNDFNIDSQNMTTTVASVTTREIQEIDSPFNDLYMTVDIPDAYRVDAKSFIERPFYVDEVTFPDTAARYTLLTSAVRFLPGDIARSNPSVLNMFKMAAYGRPDLMLNISMAGTITHAGCVLVGVLPPMPAYPALTGQYNNKLINTILTGPHAFLYANEATSVAIPVPWYCNTDLATTDMEQTPGYDTTLDITVTNGNYSTLVFFVLNPLKPSTGSSKSLKIIVEACFKNFDLAVPTPRFVTWLAQGGTVPRKVLPPLSFDNPNYDLEDIANIFNIEPLKELTPAKKNMIMNRIRNYAPYVGATATLLGALVRIAIMCVSEEALPIDEVMVIEEEFEAQSGFVNGAKDLATGLINSAFSGLKTVTVDALDAGRGLIRQYTGLHNPNIPEIHQRVVNTESNFVNYTDVPQFFEKLDPFAKYNRIVQEPIFGSALDEMAISNIVTKKQMLGSFVVKTTDNVGIMKWARPISPFQGGIEGSALDQGRVCTNNLELMHSFSRGWRGGLKLTIQSVMNNKQQCKLKVIKMYNPSVKIATAYPDYKTVVNAPTHLLEFTEGGQEHEVDLPYLCRNDITPCASNMDTEALFHGIYYIYVAQPLVVSDSSPTEIEFNVYLSGTPDLTFYGYTTANTYHESYTVIPNPTNALTVGQSNRFNELTELDVTWFKPIRNYRKNACCKDKLAVDIANEMKIGNPMGYDAKKWTKEESSAVADVKITWKDVIEGVHALHNQLIEILGPQLTTTQISTWEYDDRGVVKRLNLNGLTTTQANAVRKLFGKPQFEAQSGKINVMNQPQPQSHVNRVQSKEQNLTHMSRLMPTLDIRHFIRRMYKSQVYNKGLEPATTQNFVIPLSSYLGEMPNNWNYTPIETFSRMYYGKSAGFKFRMMVGLNNITDEVVDDISFLNLRIYYLPQNINALTGNKLVGAATPHVTSFISPYGPSDGIPLPFKIIGNESTRTHVMYEFTVPDTSFYKFMGGPNKYFNFSGSNVLPYLAQSDFGSLVLQFSNLSKMKPTTYSLELFVGLTDETRMGYHTAAPPFIVYKETSFYLGNNASCLNPTSGQLNPFVYRGGFL